MGLESSSSSKFQHFTRKTSATRCCSRLKHASYFEYITPMNFTPRNQRLLWLIRLRFVALFSQLPMTLIGRYYGYLGDSSQLLFTGVLVLALIYNIFLYKRLHQDKEFQVTDFYLTTQISLDLIIYTFLLSISGGVNNPFYSFFFVMALMGGIFSSGRGSLFFGALLIIAISMIQISPVFTSTIPWQVILNQQTLPYSLIQVFVPLVTFLVARSFGNLLNRTQERLMNLAIRSEKLDHLRALGALSAGFSHEFASPLQSAKIRLMRLKKVISLPNQDFEECQYSLEDCDAVLKKMNSAQLQFHEFEDETVSLQHTISETIERWRLDFPEVKINNLTKEAFVKAPKINLVQILINLLDNAAEAMNHQGEITLKTEFTSTHVILEISDQGPGFHLDVLSRMGEPFNTSKNEGTGLGLYSMTLFMQAIAGDFKIQNKKSGAEINLFFPLGGMSDK